MIYITTIGLEVHVQLKTRSKMFCACPVEFGADPNTHTCPVCLGLPGALPVMNHEALRMTVLTGLMLGGEIAPICKFDRKNYFYPDMPKNYQISQYDMPLVKGGWVEITTPAVDRMRRLAKAAYLARCESENAADERAAKGCKRCGKPKRDFQVFCGAACSAQWEAGDREPVPETQRSPS